MSIHYFVSTMILLWWHVRDILGALFVFILHIIYSPFFQLLLFCTNGHDLYRKEIRIFDVVKLFIRIHRRTIRRERKEPQHEKEKFIFNICFHCWSNDCPCRSEEHTSELQS